MKMLKQTSGLLISGLASANLSPLGRLTIEWTVLARYHPVDSLHQCHWFQFRALFRRPLIHFANSLILGQFEVLDLDFNGLQRIATSNTESLFIISQNGSPREFQEFRIQQVFVERPPSPEVQDSAYHRFKWIFCSRTR